MKRILDAEKVQTVYRQALKIADEIGVKCNNRQFLSTLAAKAGIRYANGRMTIPCDEMDEFFQMRKDEIFAGFKEQKEIRLGRQWHSWELCDPVTNSPRLASEKEAIDMARLSESIGSRGCPIPVAPGNINPRLHTLECEKLALIYTRSLGGQLTATDDEEIRVLIDMYLAAGRKYCLAVEPLISPLTLNDHILDIYTKWHECNDVDITIIGAIPMVGTTAPIAFPASLSQMLAEALILSFIYYKLSDGRLSSISLRLDPFDMKYSNISFGTPEWCILKQMVIELWEGLFGVKSLSGSFRTNGRNVDAQTLMQRTASFIWQVMLGVRNFSAVGQLCVDEVYSPVQAILDVELVKYANRLVRGIDGLWDESGDSMAIITDGIDAGNYLVSDSTLENFRSFYDFERLDTSQNLAIWKQAGSREMQELAWNRASKIITEYDFEINEDMKRDLMNVYRKGLKIIGS